MLMRFAHRLTYRLGDVQDDIVQEACRTAFRSGMVFESKQHAFSILRQHVFWRSQDALAAKEPDEPLLEGNKRHSSRNAKNTLPSVGSPEEDVLREEEEVLRKEAIRLLHDRLTPAGRAVLMGLRDGIQKQDIAKLLGKSKGMVTYRLKQIQPEASALLGVSGIKKD
jgi:DNA-directed RNA polymerase specialized sigma24 family protein